MMARNLYQYHPVTGYRFIAGIRARIRHEGGGYLVKANRAGFRCEHEAVPRKPDGVFRILLFGDSYTAGEGVSNRFRFGDILEALIPRVQVLNFGLPSSGTDQQYLTWREFAAGLDYDLLVICPMVENIRRNVQTHRLTQSAFDGRLVLRPKPYFVLDNGCLVLHHSPVPKAAVADLQSGNVNREGYGFHGGVHRFLRNLTWSIDQRVQGFRCLTQRLRRLALPEEYNSPQHPAWLLLREILRRWSRESRSPVVICPIPTFGHIEGCIRSDPYRERFSLLGHELGVKVIDILPLLLSESREVRRKLRFPHDEHPTSLCHQIIAQAMAPGVTEAIGSAACMRARQK
jgi:carbamoyltransferase